MACLRPDLGEALSDSRTAVGGATEHSSDPSLQGLWKRSVAKCCLAVEDVLNMNIECFILGVSWIDVEDLVS